MALDSSAKASSADAFASLRRELFTRHPLIGNFDSASTLQSNRDGIKALPYHAQLHANVRPLPYSATTGKTDLLTWYTRIEFAPTPFLLSLYFHPSPSDIVAQGEQNAFLRAVIRKRLPLDTERLLGFLGSSIYAAAYVSLALSFTAAAHGRIAVLSTLRTHLARTHDPVLVATLLDLAATNNLPVVDDEGIVAFAETWQTHRVVRHALWRYLATRPLDLATRSYLLTELGSDHPLYDRLLVATVLRAHGLPIRFLSDATGIYPHPLLENYLFTLKDVESTLEQGITVAQSMLMGQLARPGEGNSGGLGVFLSTLGSSLARDTDVQNVVTLTLADEHVLEQQDSLCTEIAPQHWAISIPIPLSTEADQYGMLIHETSTLWWVRHLLARYKLVPDVVHVRYADNGSLAVARAAKLLGAKVAFTVTPDPHRTMTSRYMAEPLLDIAMHDTLLFDLHKVFVADMLVGEADGLVGISGRADIEHLLRYFPQLDEGGTDHHKLLRAMAEGVTLWETPTNFEAVGAVALRQLFEPHPTLPRLTVQYYNQPVMLNVGRFSPIKQQDKLVAAWVSSGVWRQFNLVLIGGNATTPTPDESAMLATIRQLLAQHPEVAGRVALLPAMENMEVRLLEEALVQLMPSSIPHIYLCGSVKEEFGIAILEAMDAGLLALGPQRGGLSSYLQDGQNGFLINTLSGETLAQSLLTFLSIVQEDPVRLQNIARAGTDTVRTRFDIRRVAQEFASYYSELTS